MKERTSFLLVLAVILLVCLAGNGLATHEQEKGTVGGVITAVKMVEIELTVKDDKGKETKVRTSDTSLKVGDRVIIKDGKVSKEVKPITGGY